MTIEREYHQSILINDNQVLITGGINSIQNEKIGMKDSEIYNIKEDKFEKINDTKIPHLYHKMFKLKNGNILIADINGIEIFNPTTKTFKLLKTRPKQRYNEFKNYNFVLTNDDKLIITGGRILNNKKDNFNDLNLIEIIDINKDKLIKTIPFKTNASSLITLPNNNVLIIGGRNIEKNKEALSNKIYSLNPTTYEIKEYLILNEPISNPFAFLTNNNKTLILVGGEIKEKYENFLNFNYIIPKGSTSIHKIPLEDKKVEENKFDKILSTHSVVNNIILDATKVFDNIYLLNLKTNRKNTTILVDIQKMKELKNYIFGAELTKNYRFEYFLNKKQRGIAYSFIPPLKKYRASFVATNDSIFIFGGKASYYEVSEFSIYDFIKPYGIDSYRASAKGMANEHCIAIKVR